MPRHLWAALAVCACHAVHAAPVPPPRLATAEAVLRPGVSPRAFAAKLASAPFVGLIARSKPASSLGCLAGEKDPAAWLTSRLRASVDAAKGTVTIRLADCPRRDAVALLTAVVEAYRGGPYREVIAGGSEMRMAKVRFLIAAQQAQGAAPAVIMLNSIEGQTMVPAGVSVIQAARIVPAWSGVAR